MRTIRTICLGLQASLASMLAAPASAQEQKPNILVIMGDDIGYWNISAYNRGMMGYRTPSLRPRKAGSAAFSWGERAVPTAE